MKKERGCIKCGSNGAATEEVAMTDTGLSKLFDVQHNQFIVVSCNQCGYSEFYKSDSSAVSNVLDFFFGG